MLQMYKILCLIASFLRVFQNKQFEPQRTELYLARNILHFKWQYSGITFKSPKELLEAGLRLLPFKIQVSHAKHGSIHLNSNCLFCKTWLYASQ